MPLCSTYIMPLHRSGLYKHMTCLCIIKTLFVAACEDCNVGQSLTCRVPISIGLERSNVRQRLLCRCLHIAATCRSLVCICPQVGRINFTSKTITVKMHSSTAHSTLCCALQKSDQDPVGYTELGWCPCCFCQVEP